MNNSYRFKIGSFSCITVSDGAMTYPEPIKLLFPKAPKEDLAEELRQHGIDPEKWKEWISDYNCLIIDTGKQLILVDTGLGGLMPNTGEILPNLKAEGIEPGDIDTVIISHAHPDHIGCVLNAEGKPVFAKARYVIHQQEWDFWTSKPALDKTKMDIDEAHWQMYVEFANNNLLSLKDQLDLIKDEEEIVPGIKAVAAFGHTPGHMALSVSSDGKQLLYVGDAILHPIHMKHPEWNATVDILPEKAEPTRRMLCERAVKDNALVFAFHFPFPGFGHVVKEGTAWKWVPSE